MSTTRPFAYNIGSPITGTTQLGDLAIGVDNLNYSQQPGGVQWWNGPDEELGYIITHTTPSGTQPNPLGIPAYLGFWRSKVKTEGSFIVIAQWVSAKHGDPQIFATGLDASTWLNNNGYWTSYDQVILTPTPTPTETQPEPTPTPTETQPEPTPTPTETQPEPTPTPTETEVIPTPTPTETQPEPTPTPTETQPEPTPTPTPTETSLPVTGYSFNLVDLPYTFPSSGNSIMNNDPISGNTGSTEINVLDTTSRGFYFNALDENGIDRTSYFSTFTGQNITITFNQGGNVAIYSGDTNSLKYYNETGATGFVFGTGIGLPPSPSPSGVATLIQSSPVNYTIGLPVYVSVELNVPLTPTPTPTETQPEPTPTPTETQPIPTPTPTETQPIPTPTPTSWSFRRLTSCCGGANGKGYVPPNLTIGDIIVATDNLCYTVGTIDIDVATLVYQSQFIGDCTACNSAYPCPTPTPTPTETQPEPTPTPTETQPEPTPTPTETQPT
jgi:hypothetical protein